MRARAMWLGNSAGGSRWGTGGFRCAHPRAYPRPPHGAGAGTLEGVDEAVRRRREWLGWGRTSPRLSMSSTFSALRRGKRGLEVFRVFEGQDHVPTISTTMPPS